MEYVKWRWFHSFPDEPVLCFAELEEERYSTRQVEVFRDGSQQALGEQEAYVSEQPYPSNDEINEMGEFLICNITKEEFETVWMHRYETYQGELPAMP